MSERGTIDGETASRVYDLLNDLLEDVRDLYGSRHPKTIEAGELIDLLSADRAPASNGSGAMLTVLLQPEQATALYDLACWAMDDDEKHGSLGMLHRDLKPAAAAIIDAGGNGARYV